MSRKFFFACALCMVLGGAAQAQVQDSAPSSTSPKNIVKLNLLSPILRTFNMAYERVLNDRSSLQMGIFYTGARFGNTRISGVGLTPEYRFYLSERKNAPAGFFVAPFVRYQNLEFTNVNLSSNQKLRYQSFGGGVSVGGQWLFRDVVTLELFGGPSFNGVSRDYPVGTTGSDFDFTGFGYFSFRFGATLGFAF